jgi:hypothetical protein
MADKWPPEGHSARREGYAKNRLLFKGQHHDVFKRIQNFLDREADKSIIYIVCNYAGLISKICADLLFGEQLKVVVGEPDSKEQMAVDAIWTNNKMLPRLYEMGLSNSWRGDVCIKNRLGKLHAWDTDMLPIIESQPPDYFFPELNGDNIQEMTGCTLAWEKKLGDDTYIRKEIHKPGQIINELWKLKDGELKTQVPLSTFPEYAEVEELVETGYPGLLVTHVPNWRLDDMFWGISDYHDMESLFDGTNNRLSRIDRILDKHSDPKLILPPGSMKLDPANKRYYIEKEDLQCMEVNAAEVGDLPRYLVWDASFDAAFKELEKYLEIMMMCSEIAPAAFGLDKGGTAESGRALKYKMIRTLAKVNRKKLYFDEAIKTAVYIAQVLDVTKGSGSYEPKAPRIVWADGLPADPKEQADIEMSRKTAGLTSLKAALQRLDGLEGKALEDEIKAIKEEQKSPVVPNPDGDDDGDDEE